MLQVNGINLLDKITYPSNNQSHAIIRYLFYFKCTDGDQNDSMSQCTESGNMVIHHGRPQLVVRQNLAVMSSGFIIPSKQLTQAGSIGSNEPGNSAATIKREPADEGNYSLSSA